MTLQRASQEFRFWNGCSSFLCKSYRSPQSQSGNTKWWHLTSVMPSSFTTTKAALLSLWVSWKESCVSSKANITSSDTVCSNDLGCSLHCCNSRSWIPFLLMFSGFNTCITKYETQGTSADRCGKCKLYTLQTQWWTWLKYICRKKTYSPEDVSS